MPNNMKLMVPVEIHPDDFIETINQAIDNEDAPEFIRKLDVSYQDFEVTEQTICKLLDSMRREFVASFGESSDVITKWDIHSGAVEKMMDLF